MWEIDLEFRNGNIWSRLKKFVKKNQPAQPSRATVYLSCCKVEEDPAVECIRRGDDRPETIISHSLINPLVTQLARFSSPATLPGLDRDILEGRLAELWGSQSEINTEINSRISNRLAYVQQLLSLRPVQTLSETRRGKRTQLLQLLGLYAHLGAFPKDYDENASGRLCFMDEEGKRCAVGFLLERTRGRSFADSICAPDVESLDVATRQLFEDWVHEHGITVEELAMVQPGFFPQENPPAETGLSKAFSGLYQASLRRQADFPDETRLTEEKDLAPQPEAAAAQKLAFSSMFDLLQSSNGDEERPIRVYLVSRQYGEPVIAMTYARNS